MKYIHIGWCKEDNHDKVWGIILLAEDVPVSDAWHFLTNKYVTFWGRRGAKLQTKVVTGRQYDMDELFRKKTKRGYKEIEEWQLDEVYPEFKSDLEKTAFWATLKI
jgi:hypothetical protein